MNYIIQIEQVVFMYLRMCVCVTTLMKKEDINLKAIKEKYMGRFEGKREMMQLCYNLTY